MNNIMETVADLGTELAKILRADILNEINQDEDLKELSLFRLKLANELAAEFGDVGQAVEALENITKAFKRALK